jgi:hypothetical protein
VQAVAAAEPFFQEHHVCYLRGRHLIFIGYSLPREYGGAQHAYESACRRFRPTSAAMIGSELPVQGADVEETQEDAYYRLDLPLGPVRPNVAYMIRRATRELRVAQGSFGQEHQGLIDEFIAGQELEAGYPAILGQIGAYLEHSPTAVLLEARKGSELVAFNVMDLGSAEYAFYLFNFRSTTCRVPGASDLLLHEMGQRAEAEGKRAMNLGLGIDPGVRRFKEKWGAVPFLRYRSALTGMKPTSLWSFLKRLVDTHERSNG